MIRRPTEDIFEPKKKEMPENLNDMTQHQRFEFNKEHATATTMEYCDLLFLDKDKSKDIIGFGMNDQRFVEMLNFLWHIDEGQLFENVDR